MYANFIISGKTRDFNDMVKYPGRFNALTYDDTEGVIHKAMIYSTPGVTNLEPVDTRIAVKNMSQQNVTLTFNTQMNLWINPGTVMQSTIYPGQIASFSSLDPAVIPTLTSASEAECEVILVGFPAWPDTGPGWYCDVWTVGHEFTGALPKGVHHDSAGLWTQVAIPAPTPAELHDVAGLAANAYWAVGKQADQPTLGLFMIWNGTNWTEVAVPDDNPHYGTWGFSPNDFWTVGGVPATVGDIWFWDGISWELTHTPGDEPRCFYHVHGIDTDDVWAVGEDGMVYHWGPLSVVWTEWTTNIFPTDDQLHGVWQQDDNNLWVCGGDQDWFTAGGAGIIYHLNITTGVWTSHALPALTATMRGLWGFGGNDIYCVGDENTILHYDGVGWTAMVSPLPDSYRLRGVFGCYPWSVWAVGYDSEVTDDIIHWDTVSWTVAYGTTTNDRLYGIKGVHVEL